MVELFEGDIRTDSRRSSKGNQLKWTSRGYWYKADYTGYEGLSEYICSDLLRYSNIPFDDYTIYDTEQISYKGSLFLGCKSRDFLPEGWILITLERLFKNAFSESLYESIYKISGTKERASFLTEQVERVTGLSDFGRYLSRLLTLDALFLNEDRHTHNIAILRDGTGGYHYCPIFDNGGALLSDIKMDYPIGRNVYELIDSCHSKTLCEDFREQLEAVEELYGQDTSFSFGYNELKELMDKEPYYPKEQKERVIDIVMEQRRKLGYLFT